jgi:Core-2/I-Branching enzyme
VRPGSSVIRELSNGGADLYMDYQFVDHAPLVPEPAPAGANYLGVDKETWREIANERYIMTPNPFSDRLRCCAGDFWLTGNARAAGKLIDAPARYPDLFKYYSTSFCPDESLCHTILGNDPDLSIAKNNKRYTVWPDMGAHPNTLQLSDFDAIIRSGCHFARKCLPPVSAALLEKLDTVAVWE